MKKYLLLLVLTSCASPRPGPMVTHKMGLENKIISNDIIECERKASKATDDKKPSREIQTTCLEEKGYQIVGWN